MKKEHPPNHPVFKPRRHGKYPRLSTAKHEELINALRLHRSSLKAAAATGISRSTAYRAAIKHNIDLITPSEHMKKRWADPEFREKQITMLRRKRGEHNKISRETLEQLLAALRLHQNLSKAAERTGVNISTARRAAKKHNIPILSHAEHMKTRWEDPEFRARQTTRLSGKRNGRCKLRPEKLIALLAALRLYHNATQAAKIAGVSHTTALHTARKHGIYVLSHAEHTRALWRDPQFRTRQAASGRSQKYNHAAPP